MRTEATIEVLWTTRAQGIHLESTGSGGHFQPTFFSWDNSEKLKEMQFLEQQLTFH